jgi:hypothetical protein
MVLSGTIQVSAQTVDLSFNLLDEGPSIFRRVQVLANGSLIEDIDNAHRAANLEILASAESDWYKHDGSFANFWKFNETLSVTAATAQNDVVEHAKEMSADLSGNSYQVGWPLGLIAPSLRCNKYWPLRSMGELVLQFTMANNQEAIWADVGAPTYTFNDIFLECDIVVPHPAYASLLDRMTQLTSEPGLYLPVETRLVSQGQAIPAVSATVAGDSATINGVPNETNIVVSRATTNLRRVMYAVQPTAGLNNYAYPSVSSFPDEGCSAFQVRVGSLYFPSQPANSQSRMFYMTSSAFGAVASTDKAAVYNRHNYDTTTLATAVTGGNTANPGEVFKQVPTTGGQFQGELVNGAGLRFPYSDFSPKGYCFDALTLKAPQMIACGA